MTDDLTDYYAQNGHTAIRIAFALGGAYIGITGDVREFPGGERAQIKVSPDQAREIARSLIECADRNTSDPSDADDCPMCGPSGGDADCPCMDGARPSGEKRP